MIPEVLCLLLVHYVPHLPQEVVHNYTRQDIHRHPREVSLQTLLASAKDTKYHLEVAKGSLNAHALRAMPEIEHSQLTRPICFFLYTAVWDNEIGQQSISLVWLYSSAAIWDGGLCADRVEPLSERRSQRRLPKNMLIVGCPRKGHKNIVKLQIWSRNCLNNCRELLVPITPLFPVRTRWLSHLHVGAINCTHDPMPSMPGDKELLLDSGKGALVAGFGDQVTIHFDNGLCYIPPMPYRSTDPYAQGLADRSVRVSV